MLTSAPKTSNSQPSLLGHQGFSLIEIMVAMLLAAIIFIAIPTGDTAAKHRALQAAVDDLDRTARFAANEAVLRNTVVRLRILLDKSPVEYTVEYGPPGNIPLPDMPEKTSSSLAEEKEQREKTASFDRQFTKVEEFEDMKSELDPDVTILGVGSSVQKGLITKDAVNVYFYPTGEKDGALIFFATTEEIAFLEIAPFLLETRANYEPIRTSGVAKIEDILQTRMDEVYKEWVNQ